MIVPDSALEGLIQQETNPLLTGFDEGFCALVLG
jgi:hypothetical protein